MFAFAALDPRSVVTVSTGQAASQCIHAVLSVHQQIQTLVNDTVSDNRTERSAMLELCHPQTEHSVYGQSNQRELQYAVAPASTT